jgi:hypothetical protein
MSQLAKSEDLFSATLLKLGLSSTSEQAETLRKLAWLKLKLRTLMPQLGKSEDLSCSFICLVKLY